MRFEPAPARLPTGRRVYAIGDVHGCADRLAMLHAQIARDLADRPVAKPLLVHIGDYVDRGPDSAGVVEMLARATTPVARLLPVVNLMGNHERTMLDALAGERAAITDWLHTGGREALVSWGADPDAPAGWRGAIPDAHLDFLHALPLHHRVGGYLFVHAGIRPGIPLAHQATDDLLRIRGDFLSSERDHGFVVVHGHTPVRHGAEVYENRIAIDTGAVFGRPLTCAVLEDARVAFLEA
jgi:serine/threonine protein phosphatase 1